MFEIDLQSSASRSRTTGGGALSAGPAAFAPVVAALAVLAALLWLVSSWAAGHVAEREAEVKGLEAAVAANRQQLAEVTGKRRALFGMQQEELYWSDQLRLLSEKIPDKVWLTQVKVVTSGGGEKGGPVVRSLAVEGGVLSNPSEGNLDVIGRFIEALQADPRFQKTFERVTLESVKRASSDPNALEFKLNVGFRGV